MSAASDEPRGSLAFSWVRWRNHDADGDTVRTLTWSQVLGQRLNASLGVFDSGNSGRGINLNFPETPAIKEAFANPNDQGVK